MSRFWFFWRQKTSRCVFCLTTKADYGCCVDCRNDLAVIKRACRLCATPLKGNREWLDLCASCLQKKKDPLIDYAISIYYYVPPLRKALHYLKFGHQLYYAPVIGRLWLEAMQRKTLPFMPDLLIPVPLHPRRLRQRGFNQTTELAKPLATGLHIPLNENLCQRQRDTQPQRNCVPSARPANVKNAFVLNEKHRGSWSVGVSPSLSTSTLVNKNHRGFRSVAILDDVLTTGATVNELARVLKKGGASKIAVWTLLRS